MTTDLMQACALCGIDTPAPIWPDTWVLCSDCDDWNKPEYLLIDTDDCFEICPNPVYSGDHEWVRNRDRETGLFWICTRCHGHLAVMRVGEVS